MASVQQVEVEKPVAQASVQPFDVSPSNEEEGIRARPDRDVRNAVCAIVTGVALPCVPILAILALLLYFIYNNRVDPWAGYPELTLNTTTAPLKGFDANLHDIRHNGGSAAILVRYNPSTLTTIASWTSRIIPYLTSSIMALVAFFAARYIVQQSKKGDEAVLPDPEQLTILIGLLGGSGVTPIKDTLFYRWLKKERLISPVPAVFWVLAFITLLGFLIPAIDTWFGIATRPATVTILSNTSQPQQYGRRLNASPGEFNTCANGPAEDISQIWWGPDQKPDKSLFWPCNVLADFGASTHVALKNPADATKLQYNLATSTVLSNHTYESHNYFFYADPRASASLDFMVSTPAISTQCVPASTQCNPNGEALDGPFECSPTFKGNWSQPWPYVMYNNNNSITTDSTTTSPLGIAFASDATLSSTPPLATTGRGPSWPVILPINPFHFITWAFDFPSADSLTTGLAFDPQILSDSQSTLWFLQCSATVANLTYTYVNGSIHSFNPLPASPQSAALLMGAYSLIGVTPYFSEVLTRTLSNMATIVSVSNSSTELANTWAEQFSQKSLALAIGAYTSSANHIEQRRDPSVIVARIPLVPLYLLIGVKLIYVVAVIALAIGAYAFTHPAETEVVKAQLSTKGLAAAHFDQPGLLQENAVKAVQSRLDAFNSKRSNTDPVLSSSHDENTSVNNADESLPGQLKRSETSPAEIEGGKPKVGLVPDVEGTWKFVVMANGVWHGISPVVKSFVEMEAGDGGLGRVGGLVEAWK